MTFLSVCGGEVAEGILSVYYIVSFSLHGPFTLRSGVPQGSVLGMLISTGGLQPPWMNKQIKVCYVCSTNMAIFIQHTSKQ